MQLSSRYLVNNTTTLVADVAGFITEYRPVYNRTLEVYRGIDNTLQFRLLNADQKPVNVTTYTPKIAVYDEADRLIIERDCTIQKNPKHIWIQKSPLPKGVIDKLTRRKLQTLCLKTLKA